MKCIAELLYLCSSYKQFCVYRLDSVICILMKPKLHVLSLHLVVHALLLRVIIIYYLYTLMASIIYGPSHSKTLHCTHNRYVTSGKIISMKRRGMMGCQVMKKKGNKKMPTPRQKVIHNPIPTSLFCCCLFVYAENNTKKHNTYRYPNTFLKILKEAKM